MKIDFKTQQASDGSIKYRFKTHDNQYIEALYFLYNGGFKVLCLSTQIGCDMKCAFCHTGKFQKKRHLTQDEIVSQAFLIVNDILPNDKPDTITLAGMGEPLANYQSSLGALEYFRKIYGNIRLSLSTVGLVEGIKKMIEEKKSFGIYLSLHASDDKTRKKIIPVAKNNPIQSLILLLTEYSKFNEQGLVRISYLLLDNINDSDEHLKNLIDLVKDKNFIVQLRILNPVKNLPIQKSSQHKLEKWLTKLLENNIKAVVRPSMGIEINGACGQLYEEKQ